MTQRKMQQGRVQAIRAAILEAPRLNEGGWWWVSDSRLKVLSKKRANKYLFACTLDYQMKDGRSWTNSSDFIEGELGDPACLWDDIAKTPLSRWLKRTRDFGLHRFKDAAHRRVCFIARHICDEYGGDARLIWRNRSAAETAEKMEELGVGPNLSRMAAGGLVDTGWIRGRADVKADVYVRRTLGRVLVGEPIEPDAAVTFARELYPRNPWRLDGPLFLIGKKHCHLAEPNCSECPLGKNCSYARRRMARSR
jgi:endonuclease III